MRRVTIQPRADWQSIVETAGLVWHTADDKPYWTENAFYEFTAAEIDTIETATAELQRLFLEAGEYIVTNKLFAEFGIPDWAVPLIEQTWEEEPPSLFYGRFDLAFDGIHPPKLLEYNCDTPTALFEAAVVQWDWKQAQKPTLDQFNSLHERLVAKWGDLKPYLKTDLVHFANINDDAGEDTITVTYLRDTAQQAGLRTIPVFIPDIGWDARRRRFVDAESTPIDVLYKLYPWEWLVKESFGQHIAEASARMFWIEPIWKMMWSNKAILPILWKMFPDHPNLLPAFFERPSDMKDYVQKPRLAREGANVTIVRRGAEVARTSGSYGREGFVYQELFDLPECGDGYPVLGSWIVDGVPAGMGVREGGLITGNTGRFVPHAFVPR